MKSIELRSTPRGGGRFPLVCVPLVGRDRDALLAEAAAVAAMGPDLIEWRADFFSGIGGTAAVVELAASIKRAACGLPLLFTCRSVREGGEPIAISEEHVAGVYGAVCRGGAVDLVDFEMGNDPAHVRQVREASRASGAGMIMSFHDFQGTPPIEVLIQRFRQAEQLGADVAKIAVMPHDPGDLLCLLGATWQASQALSIPVVSMAMGGDGALSRLCGWAFGSAMTFGAGQGSSAPGQLPIDELGAGLALLRRAAGH